MLHSQMHAVEVATFDLAVASPQGADGQHHGVEPVAQIVHRQVDPDFTFGDETRSFRTHLGQALVQRRLLQLVLGDAVAQQATQPVIALVDRHVVTRSRELLRRRKARWAGSHDGHAVAGRNGRGLRFDGAVHPRLVGDGLLDALDRDTAAGLVLGDGQHTPRLARCRAQPSGELGEITWWRAGGRLPGANGRAAPGRSTRE
jgi:hypothetical protein